MPTVKQQTITITLIDHKKAKRYFLPRQVPELDRVQNGGIAAAPLDCYGTFHSSAAPNCIIFMSGITHSMSISQYPKFLYNSCDQQAISYTGKSVRFSLSHSLTHIHTIYISVFYYMSHSEFKILYQHMPDYRRSHRYEHMNVSTWQ
jgi:hypothetical protein